MNAFIAMPFAKDFTPVYGAIKEACSETGMNPLRVDELHETGPIVKQIFREIGKADFVIADISTKNPNVYYEIGLAHCIRKPTILLVNQAEISQVPFDIRHQRLVTYNPKHLEQLTGDLKKHLLYLLHHFGPHGASPTLDDFLGDLASTRGTPHDSFKSLIEEVAKEFDLKQPKLVEKQFDPNEREYLITLADAFGEKVVFSVDVNGLIRKRKRL
jgi:hypothetical protein